MLQLILLLHLAALSEQYYYDPKNYAVDIQNNQLEGVQIFGDSPEHMNLSYLNLRAVNENALVNLTNLKTLNLSANKLQKLPVFLYLPNLESLILEDNMIQSGKFYSGLSSLAVLNIANNYLRYLEPGHFFGLPNTVSIYTGRLKLLIISPAIFENPATQGYREPFAIKLKGYKIDENYETTSLGPGNTIDIEVCIQDGQLTLVQKLDEQLSSLEGCQKSVSYSGELSLINMGITTFKNRWCRLPDYSVISINLSNNKIDHFPEELINDLPTGIRKIYLSGNKIKTLKKGIIENWNDIDLLNLQDNLIDNIEYGALEKLNLTGSLNLDNNYLTSTEFLDSLPPHIRHVSMNRNNITKLAPGNFTKFKKLTSLRLANNKINDMPTLRGLSSLTHLSLQMNNLQDFDSIVSWDLKNLLHLDLSDNNISRIEEGIFTGFDKIRYINLDNNKIENYLNSLLAWMPSSLEKLQLAGNQIITTAAKILSPELTARLASQYNQCPINKRGYNNLPNLKVLDLHNNSLMDIDGTSLQGLKNLEFLSLAANKIQTLKKGLTKNLGNLHILDLSENPIKRLTNGALAGLRKDFQTLIHVNNVPLQEIQGGVFDNA